MNKRLYICIALIALFASFFAMGGGISSVSAAERTSEAFSIETDAITGGSLTAESENYKIESSTAGESAQTGSAESTNYKVYGQFQETLGSTPSKATTLLQYRSDGATVLATGEWISNDTVVLKFTVSDPDPSDFLMAQVEVKPVGTPFNNVPNKSSNEIPFTGSDITAVVTYDSLSEGSYHWQARVIDSEFRASSWESFGGNAESERDFGVSTAAPTVTVEAPNGGEFYLAGGTSEISWETASPSGVSFVNISYSSGDAYPWVSIATNESDTGAYLWNVPLISSSTMRISVEAVGGNTLKGYDISNNYFKIGPYVNVELPNGGENLTPGMSYNLMYTVSPDASDVYVRLSTDGGATWSTLITHEGWSHTGLSTYEWTVPYNVSYNCMISVEADISGLWGNDTSNTTFQINAGLPTVYVSPEGSDSTGDGSYANPFRTIQKGLNVVSAEGNVYLIPGTFTIATSEFINNNPSFVEERSMAVWPNKNGITLKLSPEATEPATIDAMEQGRIFYITHPVNITIEGISMVNGHVYVPSGDWTQGGMMLFTSAAEGSNLWLSNVYGKNCYTADNNAHGSGGFVGVLGAGNIYAVPQSSIKIFVNDSRFVDIKTQGWGAFSTNATLFINNTTFDGGSGPNGLFNAGVVNMSNSKVMNYTGTIFYAGLPDLQRAYVTNSVFYRNSNPISAVEQWSIITMESCSIYNYSTTSPGSFLFTDYFEPWDRVSPVTLKNCIIWGPTINLIDHSPYSINYCDIDPSIFVAGTGNISVEPNIASTTEGNANFFQLGKGSQVIDMGYMGTNTPTLDAAGNARPHNWLADMGAYEFQGPSVKLLYPNGGEMFDLMRPIEIQWSATDESGISGSSAITLRFSSNGGSTWSSIASVANTGIYTWEGTSHASYNCLISVEAQADSGLSNYDASDTNFNIPLLPETYVSPTGNDETGDGSAAYPFRTIQKALDVVTPEGNVYLMSGVHTLEAGQYVNSSMVNWPNKNGITLKLSPEATEPATIDAKSLGRFMQSTYPVNITIEGVTIKNGTSVGLGSAINFEQSADNARVWLNNVIVSNNHAGSNLGGGAVAVNPSCTNLIIYADNCLFDANGGSASHYGKWVATNSTFSGNYSYGGGVTFGNSDTVWTVDNCKFISNWSDFAAIVKGSTPYSVTFNASNSIFVGNGGYYCGIAQHTNFTPTNCSFYNNYAVYGNGGICESANWTSVNSVYWPLNSLSFSAGTHTFRYSDMDPNGFIPGTGNISMEPKFLSTTYGNAGFMRLGPGSPCIDSGIIESGVPSVDAAGAPRPHNTYADMGAYEFQGPSIKVVYPNGGEGFSPGDSVTITWEANDDYGIQTDSINIYASFNGGATWSRVATGEANDGAYEWTVPSNTTIRGLISIEATNASSEPVWNYDVSDGRFSILGNVVYVSPSGSDISGDGTAIDPFRTVQKGLDMVLPAGTVNMMSGVYTLEASEFVNSSMVNWPNKDGITLKLSPEATSPATMDALSCGRIISQPNAISLTIEGITMQNAYLAGIGGAINIPNTSGAYLWISNVIFQNNSVVGEWVNGCGAAINNTLNDGNNEKGQSHIFIDNSIFRNNSATQNGSAIHGGIVVANNTSFIGNHSGICGTLTHLTMTANNCIFANNTSGIYWASVFHDGYFDNNNCTFYNNSGAYTFAYVYDSNIKNAIIWGNSNSGSLFYAYMGTVNKSYCDIQPDGFTPGTGNISWEPMFLSTDEASANYLKLAPGSPCIDSAVMDSGVPTTDLAGNARPRGLGADMGPYEFQGPSIRVISPNGGEYYLNNTDIPITWISTDTVSPIRTTPVPIKISYSSDNGASWTLLTNEVNSGSYTWKAPGLLSDQCLISIEAFNELGEYNLDTSNSVFSLFMMYPPTSLEAHALPSDGPDHVGLSWTASTSEGVTGYNIYKGHTQEVYEPTPVNPSLVTDTTYNDGDVTKGIDYYYVVRAVNGGMQSPLSNMASAPQMKLTRWSTVEAPISGGFMGDSHDAVPGATIRFTMNYENVGFAPSMNIIINDKIPEYTEYKVYSATGEAVNAIKFSDDNGATFNYTPSTDQPVDPAVTNILWEVNDVYSGGSKTCTYEVVIK
jgi:uncharacterized repeat protein (TIGR01451 family)